MNFGQQGFPSPPLPSLGPQFGQDAGAANAFKLTVPSDSRQPFLDVLVDGYAVRWRAAYAITGACTLAVGDHPAAALKKQYNQPLALGDIKAGQMVEALWDATNLYWQMISQPASPAPSRAWCKFAGAVTSKTITNAVDTATDQLTVTGHGISAATTIDTVQRVSVRNTGGALPASTPSLAANTVYYARVVDANTLTLHTTAAGALDNTTRVDLSGNGSGTNTLDYVVISASYGVDAVLATSSAGSVVTGDYSVYWLTTFASAAYAVLVTTQEAAGPFGMVGCVHLSDGGLAASKRLQFRTDANTATAPTEAHVAAFGTL